MSYWYNEYQVEIPELDAFLRDYIAVCKKHSLRLEIGAFSFDGWSYVGVAPFNDENQCVPSLNLDYGKQKNLPFIARVEAEVEARQAEDKAAAEAKRRAAGEERDKREYVRLKAKFERR